LLRLQLLRTGEQEYRLLRSSHHIVHDAADSWKLFFDELARIYESLVGGGPAPRSSEPDLQYIDYAYWERVNSGRSAPRYRAEVDWWEQELQAASEPLELPFKRAIPVDGPRPAEDVVEWGLDAEQSVRLDEIARTCHATHYMSRLAAFAALLAIETGSDDFVIGTPVSTRNRAELQSMIGPFINFRMLRMRFRGDPNLVDWLADVRRTVIGVSSHSAIPWELVTAELRNRGLRLPQVAARFIVWSAVAPTQFCGLDLEPLPNRYGDSWGFRLVIDPRREADRCWAELDPMIYDPDQVRAFCSRLNALVAAASAEPRRSLRALHRALSND
jgi:hypothetical protein